MAAITPTVDRNTAAGMALVTWTPLANTDTGVPVTLSYAADLTFHITGTFNGATATLQGSNDGTNWHPLTQRGGTGNMAYTATANHAANEMPAFVRPNITGGGASTSLTVVLAIAARYAKTPY